MKDKKNFISNIIFWGSIWGIMEATLGYILHLVPQFISGNIMFSIGSVILIKAYEKFESRLTILGVGISAAIIKSTNLFMSNTSVFKVVNPIISIIIQTLFFMAAINYILNANKYLKSFLIVALAVLWRSAFVSIMIIQYFSTGYIQAYLNTYSKVFSFIFLDGFLSGIFAVLLIYFVTYISKHKLIKKEYVPNSLYSALLFLIAVAVSIWI